MDEQDQDPFDPSHEFIKTEPETGTSPTMQNTYCFARPITFKTEHSDVSGDKTTLTTYNDFEYQTTEQFTTVEIKEENIKCEMPKIEQCSDFPTQIDQSTVYEYVQLSPKTIKQELENTSDFKVTDIKQELSESVVRELLTSHYDLPTLKTESTDCYSDNYSGHTSTFTRKPLKNISHNILKKKRRMYGCPICQKNFPSSISRSTHMDGHFEKGYAVCQFCGRFVKKIDFFQHYSIHVAKNRMKNHLKCDFSSKKLNKKKVDGVYDKSFKCDTCLKTFNQKCKLRTHLIMHSGDKPFKCDVCSKRFFRNNALRLHLKSHSGEKPFKCDICSKAFGRNCILQEHLRRHNSERPFNCNVCSKGFIIKSELQRHLKIHSGEKPFKCDICSSKFSRNYALRRHLKSHSSEKPYKCDICSKALSRNCILQKHLMLHNSERPFNCNVCSKGFIQKSHLQLHLLNHGGEKPFMCDICSTRFSRNSDLRRHLQSHSSEKPFKCDICSKGFSRNCVLQKHLVRHNM